MRFLSPHLLHLAWLALIPLALYLFRKRARRVPVSTLLFFRSLSREHQESAWLRKLKKWLSLLLTLLALVPLCAAASLLPHLLLLPAEGTVQASRSCTGSSWAGRCAEAAVPSGGSTGAPLLLLVPRHEGWCAPLCVNSCL